MSEFKIRHKQEQLFTSRFGGSRVEHVEWKRSTESELCWQHDSSQRVALTNTIVTGVLCPVELRMLQECWRWGLLFAWFLNSIATEQKFKARLSGTRHATWHCDVVWTTSAWRALLSVVSSPRRPVTVGCSSDSSFNVSPCTSLRALLDQQTFFDHDIVI